MYWARDSGVFSGGESGNLVSWIEKFVFWI